MLLKTAILLVAFVALSHHQAPPPSPAVKEPEKTPEGNFLALAPSVLRAGRPYSVAVTSFRDVCQVTLEIKNKQNATIASKSVEVPKEKSTLIVIDQLPTDLPSEYPNNYYNLKISGQGKTDKSIKFEQTTSVSADSKSLSTFVQTDKAIYKPGSLVHFRAVVVTPDLKPYKEKVDIKIQDPQQNTIKQWFDLPLEHGVVGKELQLATEVILGEWAIIVETERGMKLHKWFTVEKYVLPKFEVTVTAPSHSTSKDDIVVMTKAKYTYGKGVAGSLTVTAESNWPRKTLIKSSQIDNTGEAMTRFTRKELIGAELMNNETNWGSIEFTSTVTEGLTGIARNGTGYTQIKQDEAALEIEKTLDYFKPGLPYELLVKVTKHDGSPIPADFPREFNISIVYELVRPTPPPPPKPIGPTTVGPPAPFEFVPAPEEHAGGEMKLGADGTYLLRLDIPDKCQYVRLTAQYDRRGKGDYEHTNIKAWESISKSYSPSQNYIQVTASTKEVDAGQKISFDVITTDEVQQLYVQVMSRGKIVATKQQAASGTGTKIDITTTEEMAPQARVVIYGIARENSEIVTDAMDFKVRGLFANNVQLSLDKTEAQPGEKLKIRVKADPNSFVGLLAVDQSVLLLKSGNDITQEMVESEVRSYDTAGHWGGGCPFCGPMPMPVPRPMPVAPPAPVSIPLPAPAPAPGPAPAPQPVDAPRSATPFRRRKRSVIWPWWIDGQDAASIFENAGLVYLTDALVPRSMGGGWRGPMPVAMPMPQPQPAPAMGPAPAPAPMPGAAGGAAPLPKTRSKFPETWIWLDKTSDASGQVSHEATVPDTITSWITSAFAVHDNSGLGVASGENKLRVFRPFFIRFNIPYSVKRGEKLAFQVLVFNYSPRPQVVQLTLAHDKNSGFDFVDKVEGKKTDDKRYNVRATEVAANGGTKVVFFPILPTKIGEIKLHVTAMGTDVSDAVEMPLLVEPEGYRVEKNRPVFVNLTAGSFKEKVQPAYPAGVVEGSQFAKVSVIGDLMGPTLNNLDSLVKMPYGCGEQNMVGFVPNIAVRRYLTATDRLDEKLDADTIRFMEAGYQREMTFRHGDGSFSCFGEGKNPGSTWLTAFVVKSFKQAEPDIYIDSDKLAQSISLLKQRQRENGEFREDGKVFSSYMQGGSGQGGVPLTAYVFISLIENKEQSPDALAYLENALPTVANEPYTLALVTYALHLANSEKKDEALTLLEAIATTEGDLKYWKDEVVKNPEYQWSWAVPVEVESTAYVLLTYMHRNEAHKGQSLVRWLNTQRNSYGGFSSTQDTVIALQALAAYAGAVYSEGMDVTLEVKGKSEKHSFSIKHENALVLHSYEMQDTVAPIELSASGTGAAFVQVSWHYHLTGGRPDAPFRCIHGVSQTIGRVAVDVCCNYGKTADGTGMAVLEIEALSGYAFDDNEIEQLSRMGIPDLQRAELTKANSKVSIYFDTITHVPSCVNLTSEMLFQVADQKPAQIVLYDYYSPTDRVESEYYVAAGKSLSQSCPGCWQDPDDILFYAADSTIEESKNCTDRWSDLCDKWETDGHCDQPEGIIGETMQKNCKKSCKLGCEDSADSREESFFFL